jgi:DNA replication and repair protein RecF
LTIHYYLAPLLQLQSISLYQFRNYLQHSLSFKERVVGICGLNGTGKTNLLDAIYYLSFTKSYFGRTDSQNVHHGLLGIRVEGNYALNEEPQQLTCIIRENNKKELSLNGEEYKKFSEHIGKLPCVMIAPDDVELVTGKSEERRKFIDTILSQINRQYLQHLIDYTKLLQQRNSLLKQASEQGKIDEALLGIYSEQLSTKGQYIFEQRKIFLEAFLPLVYTYYIKISGKDDGITARYESQLLDGDMKQLLQNSRQKDFTLQRTTVGIHKDDIELMMGNASFKSEASQGQRKSLLFALKLAEWQTLKTNKGFTPILLLDDVFEKLDEQRMHNLLHWVCKEDDGQVFITDTHKERLEKSLQEIEVGYQLIELS